MAAASSISHRARHRRSRGRGRGRHRAGFSVGRWMVPAGLAVAILVFVTAVLLVTDVVTSAVVVNLRW